MAEQPVTIFSPSKAPPSNPQPAVPEFRTSTVRSATAVDGVRSDPLVSEPQRRWLADQAELDRQNPWRDTKNVVISKNPDGTLTSRPRGDAQPSGAPGTGAQQQAQPGQPPQTAPAAASVSDAGTLKVGDYELTQADIASLMAEKAQRDSRAAVMPKAAADYALSLPETFQLPENFGEFHWDLETPTSAAQLGALKQWAHANQLDQSSFSQLLAIYAGHAAGEQQRFAEAQRAEIAKLGAGAPTRVDAVNTWLRSILGDQLAGSIRRSLFTADQVRGFEKLMGAFISQGVGGNPAAARTGGDNGREPARLSDAEYSKLTFHERIQYAQQFRQN